MTTLFICRANAGRSQMAEAIYNSLSGTRDATSAGVDLKNSIMKDDLAIPPLVVQTLTETGLDVSNARRKEVTESMVKEADRVIVLMQEHEFRLPAFITNSPTFVRWDDIPDAKGTDLEFHRKTRDAIRLKIEQLLGKR